MFDKLSSEQYVDAMLKRPFLTGIFQRLTLMRVTAKYPSIDVGTHFKGYKTIPIQELSPKERQWGGDQDGRSLWKSYEVKELYCYEESCKLTEKCDNGLFSAFFEAYINHGDLMITPDDIWTAIMLYFSDYVNNHSQQLRSAFVSHEGKKELIIQTEAGSFYEWNQFFDKVIIAIKDNTVKGVTEQLKCSFSSTDKFFTVFSTAIIMNSFQKYFEFTGQFMGCGIQNIHMGGTLEDWEKIVKQLSSLQQYDVDGKLKCYIQRLTPILEEFIETYKGKANIEFWNNIYHERKFPSADMYEPSSVINGWLLRFFTLEDTVYETAKLSLEKIRVPIKVVNLMTGLNKQMSMIGGCRGISVKNSIYRPHYSFAVVEMKEKEQMQRQDDVDLLWD